VRKHASRRTLKSDLSKVDAHIIRPHEYKELPELSTNALSRALTLKGCADKRLELSACLLQFRVVPSAA
jgi:hypothetical protein